MLLSARGLAYCSLSCLWFFSSHLQVSNYLTYSAGHFEDMQIKDLGDLMPVTHVLRYLDKCLVDCGYVDAVVVVDETPAMAVKIAISDVRTKVAFLAVSTIKQKDVSNAVTGAL